MTLIDLHVKSVPSLAGNMVKLIKGW